MYQIILKDCVDMYSVHSSISAFHLFNPVTEKYFAVPHYNARVLSMNVLALKSK